MSKLVPIVTCTPSAQSQYVFVYEALLDLIHCGDTEIAPQDLTQRIQALDREEQDSRETALEAEFKVRLALFGYVSQTRLGIGCVLC